MTIEQSLWIYLTLHCSIGFERVESLFTSKSRLTVIFIFRNRNLDNLKSIRLGHHCERFEKVNLITAPFPPFVRVTLAIGSPRGHFEGKGNMSLFRASHPLKQATFLRHYAAYENTIWTITRDKNRGNRGSLFAIRA